MWRHLDYTLVNMMLTQPLLCDSINELVVFIVPVYLTDFVGLLGYAIYAAFRVVLYWTMLLWQNAFGSYLLSSFYPNNRAIKM